MKMLVEDINRIKNVMGIFESVLVIRGEDGIEVSIEEDGQIVGHISLEKDVKRDEYTIIDAFLEPQYRGKGLYKKSILQIMEEIPSIKINSIFRSEEAQRAWTSFLNDLPKDIGLKKIKYKGENTTLYQIYKKTK